MEISKERIELLTECFFEYSFDEETEEEVEPNADVFKSIENPAEYHFIADIYNWDDGTKVLEWIVNSPLCNIGTAKLIFWRSQPADYTEIENEEQADWALDVFKLLKNIISNFEKGFYKSDQIYYDPNTDAGAPDVDYRDPNEKWTIPNYLKEVSNGHKIEY